VFVREACSDKTASLTGLMRPCTLFGCEQRVLALWHPRLTSEKGGTIRFPQGLDPFMGRHSLKGQPSWCTTSSEFCLLARFFC